MHHAEDRGVHADAERDGHDDDQRIARRSPEHSRAVSGVPRGRRERGSDAHVPHALLDLLDAFDLDEGRALRLRGREASPFV